MERRVYKFRTRKGLENFIKFMMGKGASKACILKAIKYYSLSDMQSEAPAKAKPLYGENGELLGFMTQFSWYNWDDEYEWKNFSKHYIPGLAEYAAN